MIKIFQSLISKFFKAFMTALLAYLSNKLGTTVNTVMSLVHDLNQDQTLDGSAKREKLLKQLKLLLISTGKEVSDKSLNLLIETAVSIYKGDA